MRSPTGLGIRNDSSGAGRYGAKRGSRIHKGTDFLCNEFQNIVAPFDMIVSRISNPKTNSPMSGIAWKSNKMTGKMFYFKPYDLWIGHPVKEGEVIGQAQSVSKDYNDPDMKDHIHLQIDSISSTMFKDKDFMLLMDIYKEISSL